MANNKRGRKPANSNSTVEKVIDEKPETVVEERVEKVNDVVKETAIKEKDFSPTDEIVCRSITSGELLMEGIRTKMLYRWVEYGDEISVEYQDLVAAIRSHSPFIFNPCFVITDEDVVSQFKQLDELYTKLYSMKDLYEILNLPYNRLKEVINELPKGAKESIKNIAASQIANGTLDSINKIKVLDEIFDTQLVSFTSFFETK